MKHTGDVRLTSIRKDFGDKTVLHDIDLGIAAGELVALLGPSGCGKTTALRIMAGFERPDGGTVSIGGRDVTSMAPRARRVGIVFQSYSLFPHMTALENVGYGLRIRKVKSAVRDAKAAELLELVGLTDHAHHYPRQMSGGQQQRVALARALAPEPEVLLLDEPLSALDAKVRVHLRQEIRRIQRELGTTTVLVTHDQEEALTMADRIAVMRDGAIEQLGTPEEVYRHPASAFVSDFVGVTNRLAAIVTASDRVTTMSIDVPIDIRGAKLGDRVTLLVRPEELVLTPDLDGSATVEAVVLRGATSSVEFSHPELTEPVRVDMVSADSQRFRAGDRVTVRIDSTAATLATAASPIRTEIEQEDLAL